jgi:hypothetical protein
VLFEDIVQRRLDDDKYKLIQMKILEAKAKSLFPRKNKAKKKNENFS